MNEKQKIALHEAFIIMFDAIVNKKTRYRMLTQDEHGERIHYVDREEYLDFILNAVYESLGDAFQDVSEEAWQVSNREV